MSGVKDGGPAFPLSWKETNEHGMEFHMTHGGMTLRDWFAANADVPWNAVIETLSIKGEKNPTVGRMAEYRALLKFEEADAMLAARNN